MDNGTPMDIEQWDFKGYLKYYESAYDSTCAKLEKTKTELNAKIEQKDKEIKQIKEERDKLNEEILRLQHENSAYINLLERWKK